MKKRLLIVAGMVCALLLPLRAYALDRFVMGTYGNGIPLSGMTVEEAKTYLEGKYSKDYVLYIKGGDKTEEIKGAEIGYQLSAPTNLPSLLQEEEKQGLKGGPEARYDFSLDGSKAVYDEAKLKEKLAGLSFLKDTKKTRNAYIVKKEEGYSIVPEEEGNSLDETKFYENVYSSLQRGENTIDLAQRGIYDTVTVRKSDLEPKLAALNHLQSVQIVTNVLGNKEVLSGEQLAEMVRGINANGVEFDDAKVLAYANYLEGKYGNPGNTVSFHSASGKDIAMQSPYALHINVEAEKEALKKAISSFTSMEREPVYRYRPAQYAQPQFGTTFLEVDLGLQHVYYYEGGNLVWESPTVTGMLSADRATPAGVFFLNGKETNRTLRGKIVNGKPEYEAHVDYWMPFNGNIGLHDASWRGKFGGNIYVRGGSHGCINLPKNKARELFQRIQKGCPVVVHP